MPCPNLLDDFGCTIHRSLRQQGFSGCTAYTCFGAGQKVAQELFGGVDWRRAPATAELMFQTLPIVRQLNELLWFVTEALDRCAPGAASTELQALLAQTELLGAMPAAEMSWGEVDAHCRRGEVVLGQASAVIRAAAPVDAEGLGAGTSAAHHLPVGVPLDLRRPGGEPRRDLRGRDLRAIDLRRADLRGADLWGARLAGADLSGADLRWADLMGTDLGGANLADADLTAAIFLTQGQLELALGTAGTTLSAPLLTPAHWNPSAGERVPAVATV